MVGDLVGAICPPSLEGLDLGRSGDRETETIQGGEERERLIDPLPVGTS